MKQFSYHCWSCIPPPLILTLVLVMTLVNKAALGQRVAPGVPPQHYQGDPNMQFQQQQQFQGQGHPPPPQHQQHQQQFGQPPPAPGVPPQQYQQHQQHIPQQHQQVPVQHHQGQVAQGGHGGHAPQGGHGHGHGGQPAFTGHVQPLLDTSNIGQERQHIQEHMSVPIDTSQMSEQELQFHYFKMHDADNNNKLDGCELVKSLIHWHDASNHDHNGGQPVPEPKIFGDDELINMIDPILQNDDKNGDGFIDYAEFSLAQAAAASKVQAQKTH